MVFEDTDVSIQIFDFNFGPPALMRAAVKRSA